MKTNKKKIIVLVSLVLLLVATGVLNYFLNAKLNPEEEELTAVTFFTSYRQDREAIRAEEILYLDSIIGAEDSDEAAIASAQEKKLGICDIMETELVLEGLIKSKGFEDCIVTISTENIHIVVKAAEITKEQSAQILNVVLTETDATPLDVVITPYA
jgi:stage III sporulation protein AH